MSAPPPVAIRNRYCQETAQKARDIPTPLALASPGSRNTRLRPTSGGREAGRPRDRMPSWPPPDVFVCIPTGPMPAPAWRGLEEISDRLRPPVPEDPGPQAHQTAAA